MKLFLDGMTEETIGKYAFLSRLKPSIEKIGVSVQFDITNADVILACNFREFKYKKSTLPKAIRPVFIHPYNGKEAMIENNRMLSDMKCADMVIWQSYWFADVVKRLMRFRPKCETVIHNGCDPQEFENAINPYKIENNIIMVGGWGGKLHSRPRKRLEEMIEIALIYLKSKSCNFWIVGNGVSNVRHPNIHFLGELPFEKMKGYLKYADAMLNLSWFDDCPNTVVESLVAGTPVICNNQSGAAELGAIVVKIDNDINELGNSRKPPKFHYGKVIKTIDHVINFKHKIKRPDLYINEIAKQYKTALEDLINGHRSTT